MKEEREATDLVGAESFSPKGGMHTRAMYIVFHNTTSKFLFTFIFKQNTVASLCVICTVIWKPDAQPEVVVQ